MATSLFWFSTVLIFRCLSISIITLYVRHFAANHCQMIVCEEFPGLVALPISILIVGNMLIRLYHKCSKSMAFIDGAMSAVAPVKFFMADRKDTKLVLMGKNGRGIYISIGVVNILLAISS